MSQAAQPLLSVTSTTWNRDTHSLFDYESKDLLTETFDISGSAKCSRDKDSLAVRAMPCGQSARRTEDLCQVEVDAAGGFSVEPAEGQRARPSWLVVRDLPEEDRRLSEGAVVKLGRFEVRVRQLAIEEGTAVDVPADADAEPPALHCVPCGDATSKMCRICLMEGEDDPEADPLVAPCSCKGSIEHVHLGCLRHWLQNKVGATANEASYFKYEPPQCELCKTCLPRKVEGQQPLVALPQMQAPFIVLESRNKKGTPAALHAVSLASGKAVRLGRSKDCEVRIDDVTLSRIHASIRFDNGTFILDDNKSKFGTLLALKKRHRVTAGQRVSLQVGRTVLALGSPVQSEQ